MPYPILTLPYPFAKRLRQLLSPFELQDLQIAAGVNLINPLKPIVSSHKDFGVCFQGNPNDTTKCELFRNSNPYSYDVINIRESEQYLMKCKSVRLHEMSNTALERVNQNSLLIKTYEFEIEESRISNVFLNNLSKITVGSSRFGVHNSYFDEDVTFLTMLDCFPHLSSIVLNNAYFGWLNDLSGLEKRLQFIFMHDYFEKIFNFRPEELYDFVAKQGPKFRLQFYVKTDDINITEKIKPFIDPRFHHGDFGNANFLVVLQYNHSTSLNRMEYALPGSEKNWFTKRRY